MELQLPSLPPREDWAPQGFRGSAQYDLEKPTRRSGSALAAGCARVLSVANIQRNTFLYSYYKLFIPFES